LRHKQALSAGRLGDIRFKVCHTWVPAPVKPEPVGSWGIVNGTIVLEGFEGLTREDDIKCEPKRE
jgi:hypothetical protein